MSRAEDVERSTGGRPLISVLLACRNAARHLAPALAGLDAQRYRPIEVIAVDDGSADGTRAMLDAFAESRPWTRVLATPGIGPAGARARAFEASRGPWIAVHDADDVSDPERFERQSSFLAAHPDVGVLGTAADVIDEAGARIGDHPVPRDPRAVRRLLRRAPPFVHGSVLMRREAYVAAGGYRAAFRVAEDYDLWLRIPPRWRMANLAEPLYRWRLHDANSFRTARDQQLEFLALARAFADERRITNGRDSAAALLAAGGLEAFRRGYAHAPRLARYRAEAFLREGRPGEGRAALSEAWRASSPRVLVDAAAWWLASWLVHAMPRARRARDRARAGDPRSVSGVADA